MNVGGYEIDVDKRDKVLFPEAGLTKGDLVDYYHRIADVMLPHMQDRPISMQRFPNGIDAQGFYQKEAPDYFPEWIERVEVVVEEEDGSQPQVVVDKAATLVYLAEQGVITTHVWLSRADRLRIPDRMIFDLDPPEGDFETVRFAAGVIRGVLNELGLVPFLMTTGSKGLHVVTPIERHHEFDTVRGFARRLSDVLADRYPDRFTTQTRKKARKGRLFLDYLRNSYAQHTVAPYSVRAKPGAPIATPLDWHELDDKSLVSQTYTMQNIFRRLGQKDDPWADIQEHARPLDEAQARLDEMEENGQA